MGTEVAVDFWVSYNSLGVLGAGSDPSESWDSF